MAYVFKGEPEPAPRNKPKPLIFDPSKCGTRKGYKQHQNHGVPTCTACRSAHNEYMKSYYRERSAA
ncbi:MAG: hypothetical protein ACLGIS_11625 [Actinomycetes bacterium]